LNPGASLGYEYAATDGRSFRDHLITFSLFDVMRLTMKDTVTVGLDYQFYDYLMTSPPRRDRTWSPKLSAIHLLTPKWTLLDTFSYSTNSSTIPDSYSYSRWTLAAGAT